MDLHLQLTLQCIGLARVEHAVNGRLPSRAPCCAPLQRGLLDPEKEDPFSLFVASTNIRYCYYSETHKILGNTYGMLVLQVRWSVA